MWRSEPPASALHGRRSVSKQQDADNVRYQPRQNCVTAGKAFHPAGQRRDLRDYVSGDQQTGTADATSATRLVAMRLLNFARFTAHMERAVTCSWFNILR